MELYSKLNRFIELGLVKLNNLDWIQTDHVCFDV